MEKTIMKEKLNRLENELKDQNAAKEPEVKAKQELEDNELDNVSGGMKKPGTSIIPKKK